MCVLGVEGSEKKSAPLRIISGTALSAVTSSGGFRGGRPLHTPPPRLAAQRKKSMHALASTCTGDLQYLISLSVCSATALIVQSDRAIGALMGLLLHCGILTKSLSPNTCGLNLCADNSVRRRERCMYVRFQAWGIACYDAVHTGCIIKHDHTSVPGLASCTLSWTKPGNSFDKIL